MSALFIPLTIMFSDVLACRMILDLRSRGVEINEPTTHHRHHQNTLPLSGDVLPSSGGTAPPGLLRKAASGSGTSLPVYDVLPYNSDLENAKRGGLMGILDAGRTNTFFTTTINSSALASDATRSYSQQSSGSDAAGGYADVEDFAASGGSVELRSFSPRVVVGSVEGEKSNAIDGSLQKLDA